MDVIAVRREKIILEVEDNASNPLLRSAAAAKVLDKALDGVDRSGVSAGRGIDGVGQSAGNATRDLDRFSGRLGVIRDIGITLGPAFVPIAALAVPAVAGLAAQLGAAAIGAGTMVVAFQGVGETLDAVNKAALEPTTENLAAAELAMSRLAPEAQSFITELQAMRPAFTAVRDAAAAGLFPGLEESMGNLLDIMPRLEGILGAVGDAVGDLSVEFSEGLSGPRGQEFLAFIQAEVPSALTDLGRIVGNVASGMAEMWQAFTPLNRDFSSWMLDAARSFDEWADGLSRTEGFNDFVAYVRANGPKVADALGAIGNAVLKVVEAAAPMGGPVLAALEAFANVVAAIANSPFGPVLFSAAAGMVLLNRSIQGFKALQSASLFTTFTGAVKGSNTALAGFAKAGAALVGFQVATIAVKGFTDALREALPGTEELTGRLLDLNSGAIANIGGEFDSLAESIRRIDDPYIGEHIGGFLLDTLTLGQVEGRNIGNARAEIEALDEALSGLVTSAGPEQAAEALQRLAESQGLSSEQTAKLIELLPQYRDALAGAANQAKIAGEAGADGGAAAARGFERAKSAAQEFADAVTRANRILEGRGAAVNYEQAIDDMTKSIKENGRTLDINTQKGRNNRQALDNMASSAIEMSKQLKVGNRLPFLEKARGDISDAAQRLGLTRAQANELADKLLQLDKIRANPKVTVETARAQGNVQNLLNAMAQIRDRTVTVTTVFTQSGNRFKDFGPSGSADGSTVPKDGGSYADRYPYLLAPGEEVISNRYGQADRNRPLLKAINAGLLAGGGTAGVAATSMGSWPNVRAMSPTMLEHSLSGFNYALVDGARSLKQVLKLREAEAEAARKRLDEEKQALNELRDARRSLVQSTRSRFTSDLWGQTDAQGNPISAIDILNSDTDSAQSFARMVERLREMGLTGGALNDLIANGSLSDIRSMAFSTPEQLAQYQELYALRQQYAQQAGAAAGNAVYAEAIKEQTREAKAAREEFQAANRSLKRLESKMDKIEKAAGVTGPDRTAKGVGRELKSEIASGTRKGNR